MRKSERGLRCLLVLCLCLAHAPLVLAQEHSGITDITEETETSGVTESDPPASEESSASEETSEGKNVEKAEEAQKRETTEKPTSQGKSQSSEKTSQASSEDQFTWAPEDPSFLYETRFIPDIHVNDGFLNPEIEKELIIDKIQKQDQKKDLKLKLPNLTQTLLFIAVLLLFLFYRMRVKKRSGYFTKR